jgi:hypothetical protein
MPERVGDQATIEPPKFERCSILLTLQQLMISDSNRTTELRTKQPRRDGGGDARRGYLEKRRGGGPATFRLRADHTQLGRAVLFCSLYQKSGPFLRRRYPATTVIRRRATPAMAAAFATLRPRLSPLPCLPRLPEPPFRRAVPTTPADRAGARVDCFPTHTAFPKWQEGRRVFSVELLTIRR